MTEHHPEAAHAASEYGHDDTAPDQRLPEGAAIVMLAAVALVVACLGVVHLLAYVLTA